MNCLDCAAKDLTAPALGVRTSCCAGLCGAHLRQVTHTLTCTRARSRPPSP